MKYSKIVSIILIFFSLFFIFLLIDSSSNNLHLLGKASSSFSDFINYYFGDFSFSFFSIFLFYGIIILLPLKNNIKIFTATGYTLINLFFPPLVETIKFKLLHGGIYGINLSLSFQNLGFIGSLILYFSWFFTSIFLILFPFRNKIVLLLLNILSSTVKDKKEKINIKNNDKIIINNNINNKRIKNNNRYPWLSKVIYEDIDRRIEIPVIPKNIAKPKKFKLKNDSSEVSEYEEVDTFSEINKEIDNKDLKEIKKDFNYYENLKNNWPKGWKNKKKEIDDYNYDELKEEILRNNNYISTEEIDELLKQEEDKQSIENINLDDNIEELDTIKDEYNNQLNLELIDKNIKNKNYIPINNNSSKLKNFVIDDLPESNILIEKKEKINSSLFKVEQNESAFILEDTLKEFGIEAKVTEIIHGPVVTLYKLIPAPGIKLQKIEGLSNNLALRLAAKSIRIIAPIPGEKVVGIEIPNKKRILVSFKEIVNSDDFLNSDFNVPIGLGKDIYGNIIVIDLFKMPHVLIAGATGAGKSVCVNAIIASILFSKTPDDVKLILIDPKIVELKPYNNIPHLLTPVITDPSESVNILKYLIYEMERRYNLLDQIGARDIVEYRYKNTKNKNFENMPFILTIVDEFADLLSTQGKEVEIMFSRIAAKARAVGIHLVLATQRPSTDVITGLIKANIPARIAFQVISLQDSRIILDQKGAEKLLGQGDMLYLSPTQPFPIRLQGVFLSKDEVDMISDHWKKIAPPNYIDINEILNIAEEEKNEINQDNVDPLFNEALEIIYETQKASASYLQRRLGIGYNRAARIIEEMESMGIVGPQKGSKPREIISVRPPF